MKKQSPGIRAKKPLKVVKAKTEEGKRMEEPSKTGEEKQADEKKEFKLEKPDITFGEK